ncbi:hypothetical protein KY285_019850 [Solanum tuberosum]|nr:hypothetical protein KY285_019850 [Solanum tuberosum]
MEAAAVSVVDKLKSFEKSTQDFASVVFRKREVSNPLRRIETRGENPSSPSFEGYGVGPKGWLLLKFTVIKENC